MRIRLKGSEERSRCGHGILTDERGQDQPADKARAQHVSPGRESVERRPRRGAAKTTPPSRRRRHRHGE
jgi:hypothetical protein